MAILFYIRTRLRRSVLQSMSILLLFAALLAFFGFFEGFLSKKEQELDAAWNTVPVTVTVSNLTGTKEEDLDIHGYLVNYFLSDRYLFEGREQPRAFSSYFQNVQVTGKVYYSFGGVWSDMQKLVGMTEVAAEGTFSPLEKGRISFYSGYANGVALKDIQVWLGHSDIGTTSNIYTHLSYSSKVSSAQAILGILPD